MHSLLVSVQEMNLDDREFKRRLLYFTKNAWYFPRIEGFKSTSIKAKILSLLASGVSVNYKISPLNDTGHLAQ